jgi:type IX secretion system PorP/SprF family membrane protein
MKTHKLTILSGIIILLMSFSAKGQQMPQFSQYYFNDYMINSAVAGTHSYLQVRAFSRMQWIGIPNSPQTYSVSFYGPTKEKDMGYGGYMYGDYTGPTSRLVFKGSYAYNIAINSSIRISGGISVGGMQYKVDGTSFNDSPVLDNDPSIDGTVKSMFTPDASAGVMVYSTYFFAGISAHQLFGNKLKKITNSNSEATGVNRLKQHFYLMGGYNFILNKDFILRPTILVREMFPTTPQVELTTRLIYQKFLWGGLAYRYNDAVSLMGGYTHESRWYFGLSYDITTSELRQYSRGTVEFMFGFKFDAIK